MRSHNDHSIRYQHVVIDVLLVLEINQNLLSIGQLLEKNYFVSLKGKHCTIFDQVDCGIISIALGMTRVRYLHILD